MKTRYRTSRRPRATPEQRTELLEAFNRSDLSAAQFAAQHGIGASTLFAWRRRFWRPGSRPTSSSPDKSLFKQVSLAEVLGNGSSWAGELQLADGTQLRWAPQTSPAQLQLVLQHLCRPC